MTDEKKKMLFFLTHGMNAPQLARAALMFASISAAMDVETVLYCIMEGAEILVKGRVDEEIVKPGKPTLRQRMNEAIEQGVKFQVCDRTLKAKDIDEEDLIEEAEVVGAATLIDLALDCDGVLCF
ncbi:MAG: DsrE family protein [Candidatus Hydrothermarchaeales archaeon]